MHKRCSGVSLYLLEKVEGPLRVGNSGQDEIFLCGKKQKRSIYLFIFINFFKNNCWV